ncbi:MAG: helix-turn-helix domain-containing protein [Halioglobus sp.]
MTLLGAILLFGTSQGLLLCVVILCIKTGDRSANALLGLFLGISAVELGLLALSYSGLSFQSGLYKLYAVAILKGPALYLYVRALTEPGFRLAGPQLKHLALIIPNLLVVWLLTDRAGSSQPVTGEYLLAPASVYWYSILLNLISLAYAAGALGVLNRYRNQVEDLFSSIEEISLGWLKWLLVFYITLRLGNIVLDAMRAQGMLLASYKSYAVALLNIGVIYFVSIGGLRQPIIFSGQFRNSLAQPSPSIAQTVEKAEGEKYGKSGLSDTRIDRIWQQLNEAMNHEHLYANPELTLPVLADTLNVSANDLSRVINSREDKSFYDFVNSYRVKAASALLRNPKNDSRKMLDLAMEAGFKSQSTFYNHFKKQLGLTPSQYRATAGDTA